MRSSRRPASSDQYASLPTTLVLPCFSSALHRLQVSEEGKSRQGIEGFGHVGVDHMQKPIQFRRLRHRHLLERSRDLLVTSFPMLSRAPTKGRPVENQSSMSRDKARESQPFKALQLS